MLIEWGCAQEARRSDAASLASCGRWRRPRESEGSGRWREVSVQSERAACGSFRSVFPALRFRNGCPPRRSGVMWRSGLCLRDGWRRLLNRPSGGPVVSVQTGTNSPSPFRAYVPPAGKGGQARRPLAWGRAGPRWAGRFRRAERSTEAGLGLTGLHRPVASGCRLGKRSPD